MIFYSVLIKSHQKARGIPARSKNPVQLKSTGRFDSSSDPALYLQLFARLRRRPQTTRKASFLLLDTTYQGATAANVSLPEPGTCVLFKGCSLGANRNIVVSTDVPRVENITSTKPPARGPYGVHDEIDVTVWFTEPVEVLANVTNTPRLRYGTYCGVVVVLMGRHSGWRVHKLLRVLGALNCQVPSCPEEQIFLQ